MVSTLTAFIYVHIKKK